ncbi:hypothetical protein EDD80_102336 [Anseongella ginsenosidimutans]|uniref:Uncharacterized protein n=1 Tax=Anseongella ginsenosidimutans TaxID=496056 RepID=A0A4R3KYR8_9SPHI|nr:DUF4097 family beta strand repeat-containing protein [Anseongella ginsenosidimutans]QEC51773.1 DUF4097 domain-containing protein [Anseongella ginsenosidimutans]TCS89142.1 hypothetical protein EDD80_102336 [Anseongella ginsenosidimutans]
MKNLPRIFKGSVLLAAILLAGAPLALAQSKKFSKTYPASSGASLSINNQFGNVIIHTWNKNEVQADVSVVVNHGNERKAQELLDAINISSAMQGNEISFKTSIGKDKLNLKGNASMQVNYEVYLPVDIRLDLANKFGNTVLPNLKGSTQIKQSFGNLETGNLTGEENELSVEFSEGSIKIGNVKNLDATFSFSSIAIAGLTGQAEIDVRHCGKFELGAGSGLNSLELDAEYSDVDIELAEDLSAQFDVSTNFGNFRYGSRIHIDEPEEKEESRGPKFNFNYTGTIGKGGNCLLSIDSDFSTINFR